MEDVVLKGTSSVHLTTKQIIGSDTVYIQKDNLPNIKLKTDSFSLSRGTMDITGTWHNSVENARENWFPPTGAFTRQSLGGDGVSGAGGWFDKMIFTASKAWTGSTSEASPYTEALGSGTALNITPKSYIVNMWLRLT